eukprot:TRINITY_DN83677_c0_g1_i1.p1 TRINITY_DN83677_c0_g1~~TRINITY_DN83677_c0_g1_i1.p1  ORF type:complete len:143 (-),score=1.17 TRINITY_DN83677_c0_g1_i1:175-558(-)
MRPAGILYGASAWGLLGKFVSIGSISIGCRLGVVAWCLIAMIVGAAIWQGYRWDRMDMMLRRAGFTDLSPMPHQGFYRVAHIHKKLLGRVRDSVGRGTTLLLVAPAALWMIVLGVPQQCIGKCIDHS